MSGLIHHDPPLGETGERLSSLLARLRAGPGLQQAELDPEVRALLAQCAARDAEPPLPRLRTLHHFACTGGTLFSKCIAAMPCTRVLSEVDPLSEMTAETGFVPTDLIGLAQRGSNPPEQKVLARIFLAGLKVLEEETRAGGCDLVLRDHTHSHFCFGDAYQRRPSLREILGAGYRLRSLVTVRHPLDSYLSLLRQGWVQFMPDTLAEYARRYGLFLDHYAAAELLRYEDFVAAPQAGMQRACQALELAFNPDFEVLFGALRLSGDSGRSGASIGLRPRRQLPENLAAEARADSSYQALCARLGYDPDPEAPPLAAAC